LDDRLSENLSHTEHLVFDLETDFDLHQFFNILANEGPGTDEPLYRPPLKESPSMRQEKNISTVMAIPNDDEWGQWRKD
jgi:hypothetical protein